MASNKLRLLTIACVALVISSTNTSALTIAIDDVEVEQGGATACVAITITSDAPSTDLPIAGYNFPIQTTSQSAGELDTDDDAEVDGGLGDMGNIVVAGDDLPVTLSYGTPFIQNPAFGSNTVNEPNTTPPLDMLEDYDRVVNGDALEVPGDEISFTDQNPIVLVELCFDVDPSAPAGTVYDINIVDDVMAISGSIFNVSGVDSKGDTVSVDIAELIGGSITVVVPEPSSTCLLLSLLAAGFGFVRRGGRV